MSKNKIVFDVKPSTQAAVDFKPSMEGDPILYASLPSSVANPLSGQPIGLLLALTYA